MLKEYFPMGAVKIAISLSEGDDFKIKSNYADAEEGTCIFIKGKEAPKKEETKTDIALKTNFKSVAGLTKAASDA